MPTKLLPIKTAFIISATVIIFSPILYTLIYSLASLYKWKVDNHWSTEIMKSSDKKNNSLCSCA